MLLFNQLIFKGLEVMEKLYLVDANNFDGSIISLVINGVVEYSGSLYNNGGKDLTVSEYSEIKGLSNLQALSLSELHTMLDKYDFDTYLSQPAKVITSERFFDMLEILPPCNWKRGSIESFYMSEFTTGTITQQFAKMGNVCISKYIDIRDKETFITANDFPD